MQHGWFWFDTECVRLFKWNVQLHSVFFLQVYSNWTFIQICSSKYPSDESRIIVLNNRYIETFGGTCWSASANRLWWWSAFIWWNISTKGWVVTRETATVREHRNWDSEYSNSLLLNVFWWRWPIIHKQFS